MFTYCLVTKGRREYLPSILESLEIALQSEDVQVIVIDNGCPDDISKLLSGWCGTGDKRKHYVRFDINDTSPPRIWHMLRNFEVQWLNFPGDDDVIHPDFLEDARVLIGKEKNLTAIASSMRIIDSRGKPTGQIRQPLEYFDDHVQYLASSFHQPPFLFPGLFINFSKITMPLPYSRYIFDWWLSLNLVSLGQIASTSKISIDYRVHGDQESALAPSRRKYFEAQVILSRFIQAEVFQRFLFQLSDEDRLRFWKLLADHGPIYGDVVYGKALMLQLSVLIADSMSDATHSSDLLGMFAAANGTFLRSGEANVFLSAKYSDISTSGSNFRLTPGEGTCTELVELINATQDFNLQAMNFIVGCRHSRTKTQFTAECNQIKVSPHGVLDLLIVQITERLEMDGALDFKISPTERKIIGFLRTLKNSIPPNLVSVVRKVINR
jgi:hypothetical protein